MIAEGLDEVLERRMLVLQAPELVRLQGKERRLEPREKRGGEDECADEEQNKEESGHSAPWSRVVSSRCWKSTRASLPLISAASRLLRA